MRVFLEKAWPITVGMGINHFAQLPVRLGALACNDKHHRHQWVLQIRGLPSIAEFVSHAV